MDPSPSTKEHEISEHDIHARVLLAVHQEFLKFGLKFAEDQELAACLAQSATGAFPPLRYNDVGGGRVVVVHALAMFDDLIVSAIAAPAALAELELREEDFETRRRIVLSTNVWAAAAAAEAETGKGTDQQRSQPNGEAAPAGGTTTRRNSPLREALRSRVRSGLLLHLCPSPGPFADLFGCGDEVRRGILGVLGARDLATFALTSRSAAVSAVSNALWAPLLQASFPERDFLEELTRPPPPPRSPSSLDRDYHRRWSTNGAAQNGGFSGFSGFGGVDGGGGGGGGDLEEGALWRYYADLSRRRKAEEQVLREELRFPRASVLFWDPRTTATDTTHGGLASNGFAAPQPNGPWHPPGPAFPEYDWGPGIGETRFSPPPPSTVWVDDPNGQWGPPYGGPGAVGGPNGVAEGGGFVPGRRGGPPGNGWAASDHHRWW